MSLCVQDTKIHILIRIYRLYILYVKLKQWVQNITISWELYLTSPVSEFQMCVCVLFIITTHVTWPSTHTTIDTHTHRRKRSSSHISAMEKRRRIREYFSQKAPSSASTRSDCTSSQSLSSSRSSSSPHSNARSPQEFLDQMEWPRWLRIAKNGTGTGIKMHCSFCK